MIDPLEAVLKLLHADVDLATLTGDRIASKQNYGEGMTGGWTPGDASLVVKLDGGIPDIDVPVQSVRLEVSAYAPSPQEAAAIWARVVAISRAQERQAVVTVGGTAYVYWLLQASGPSMLYDRDLSMELCLSFFEALVCEEAAA